MEMNKETLVERLNKLIAHKQQLIAQHKQMTADINATSGSIQDCEYWLGVVEAEDKKEEEVIEAEPEMAVVEKD